MRGPLMIANLVVFVVLATTFAILRPATAGQSLIPQDWGAIVCFCMAAGNAIGIISEYYD